MENPDPFDGDEDAALRYAIELSLQDTRNDPIEIQSDTSSNNDDLDKKPAYPPVTKTSKGSSTTERSTDPSSLPSQVASTAPTVPTAPVGGGLAGIDRKRMEEERLARLGKRKAPDSSQEAQERRQKAKTSSDKSPPTASPSKSTSLPFPTGVVKKTWAAGYPRKGDDIKIEEVLQKDQLELAVLSSFQWDEDWLLSKIDITKTKMLLVAFASSAAQVWMPLRLEILIRLQSNRRAARRNEGKCAPGPSEVLFSTQ